MKKLLLSNDLKRQSIKPPPKSSLFRWILPFRLVSLTDSHVIARRAEKNSFTKLNEMPLDVVWNVFASNQKSNPSLTFLVEAHLCSAWPQRILAIHQIKTITIISVVSIFCVRLPLYHRCYIIISPFFSHSILTPLTTTIMSSEK